MGQCSLYSKIIEDLREVDFDSDWPTEASNLNQSVTVYSLHSTQSPKTIELVFVGSAGNNIYSLQDHIGYSYSDSATSRGPGFFYTVCY